MNNLFPKHFSTKEARRVAMIDITKHTKKEFTYHSINQVDVWTVTIPFIHSSPKSINFILDYNDCCVVSVGAKTFFYD